jgi:capsular exopolysaccharide synthesis family protein
VRRATKALSEPGVEALIGNDGVPSRFAAAIDQLVQEVFDQLISRGVRALAICGVAEGDGVSEVAAALATALGRAGVSTLLVDGDLRPTSRRSSFASLAVAPVGLTDLLISPDADAEETIQFNVRPGLAVLLAGEPDPGVADALSGVRFATLMEGWLREFEFVIIDTPPANQMPDALRIARLAGYALLVVRRDETFVSDLSLFIQELQEQGVTVLGSVLNEG